MSLLLSRLGKPTLVRRSSLLLLSNAFSSSSLRQTPPCTIMYASPCDEDPIKVTIWDATESWNTKFDKKVPVELMEEMGTIGASHGWVATLKDNGILRLQDDFNPAASKTDPKRIPLPPLITLPRCQTKVVTNVSMSTSSPEDEDCVVAVKFLGPQLSFCRPAQSNSEWTNIRIESGFYSSRVMFSNKHGMFRMPGSGGHLIGSWDLCKDITKPKLRRLRFQNIPELTKAKRELMDSCCKTEHLVESTTTGETFLVKWYRKAAIGSGSARMKTEALMVFRLDEEGNAVYTQDIGELIMFLSKSEPFCVRESSFPRLYPNIVELFDVDEYAIVNLDESSIISPSHDITFVAPYHIPPQNIDY